MVQFFMPHSVHNGFGDKSLITGSLRMCNNLLTILLTTGVDNSYTEFKWRIMTVCLLAPQK